MKRIVLVLLVCAIAASGAFAQDEPPSDLVSVNLFGPFVGLFQGSYETGISGNVGLQISVSYLNIRLSPILGAAAEQSGLEVWNIGGSAGAFFYPGDTVLEGFFAGPRVGASYFFVGDSSLNVTGLLTSLEAVAGYRWLFGNFALALGGEFSYAFSSVELSENNASSVGAGVGYGILVAFDIAF